MLNEGQVSGMELYTLHLQRFVAAHDENNLRISQFKETNRPIGAGLRKNTVTFRKTVLHH